jgi:hypothetical protein
MEGHAMEDQAALRRLEQFRTAHPEVVVGSHGHVPGVRDWWEARVPEPDGETVVTRPILGDLLDRLDEITGAAA